MSSVNGTFVHAGEGFQLGMLLTGGITVMLQRQSSTSTHPPFVLFIILLNQGWLQKVELVDQPIAIKYGRVRIFTGAFNEPERPIQRCEKERVRNRQNLNLDRQKWRPQFTMFASNCWWYGIPVQENGGMMPACHHVIQWCQWTCPSGRSAMHVGTTLFSRWIPLSTRSPSAA